MIDTISTRFVCANLCSLGAFPWFLILALILKLHEAHSRGPVKIKQSTSCRLSFKGCLTLATLPIATFFSSSCGNFLNLLKLHLHNLISGGEGRDYSPSCGLAIFN